MSIERYNRYTDPEVKAHDSLHGYFERQYGRRIAKHMRYGRLAALCYALLALALVGALLVMILRMQGFMGDFACRAWLCAAGIFLVGDAIACRVFDVAAKNSLAAAAKCEADMKHLLLKDEPREDGVRRCSMCGRNDILLTIGNDGLPVCDSCRVLCESENGTPAPEDSGKQP